MPPLLPVLRRGPVGPIVLVAALLSALGCQRDPLERKVAAGTATSFSVWRASIDSDGSIETRRLVAEALLEIRLKISGDRELQRLTDAKPAVPPLPVDDAVRARVDGRILREVVQLGYELRVARLESELAGLVEAMRKNANLITRPGDVESRQHLDGLRERQQARVDQYRADLAAAQRELAPLVARSGRRLLDADGLENAGDATAPERK